MNGINGDWLRKRRDQLYLDMIQLNDDSDKLKKLAKNYYGREYRNKFMQLSYAIDDQVDEMDEVCMVIDLHLKNIGKKR